MAVDYSSVTEVTGVPISSEALAMMWTRYAVAGDHAVGRDVLEVGCGSGQGLGYLASRARLLVGGDYTERLLHDARRHYGDRVHLVCLDGQMLPFCDAQFDVVIFYEAVYYLAEPEAFVRECRRVLRRGGKALICSANCQWVGFNPSPYSRRYYTAGELQALLEQHGFDVQMFGAFPEQVHSVLGHSVRALRRLAVRLHLIPKTMRGKVLLKRLFYGPLVTLGPELQPGMVERAALVPLCTGQSAADFKVIYAIATLK